MNRLMLSEGTLLRNGTYKVVRALSNGGFGNTYVVENTNFNEIFAMKEFFMKGVNDRNGTSVVVSQSDNEEVFKSQKEKFKKEAQRLRKLNHPGIVKIYDLFDENDTYYYVMDYIDGESLATRKTMTEQEAMEVLVKVLDVLSVVHGQGLTHMDIKPANIMMGRDGKVYLIDFGASKLITTTERNTLSTATAMSYTKDYAPIEQVNEEFNHIGPATDFYALGATLYKLLTGNQPPSSSSIIDQGNEAFNFPDNISESVKSLVYWMMQPSRKKRPQSVSEIQSHLNSRPAEPLDQDTSSVATVLHVGKSENVETEETVMAPERNDNPRKRMWWIGILLLMLAVGIGVWLLTRKQSTPRLDDYDDVEEAVQEVEKMVIPATEYDDSYDSYEYDDDAEAALAEDDDNGHYFGNGSYVSHHFTGDFIDANDSYPVLLDFTSDGYTASDVVYTNVSFGGKIRMQCTTFSPSYMVFEGKDGSNDFTIELYDQGNDEYAGDAVDGNKRLRAVFYATCSH